MKKGRLLRMRTTFNELQEVNINAKMPFENITDEKWQQYFDCMKMIITPAKSRKMTGTSSLSLKEGDVYKGETQSKQYQKFINDILHTIRHGEVDYCFFVYQIADLLKFEQNITAKWINDFECFEISLAQSY